MPSSALPVGCTICNGVLSSVNPDRLPKPSQGAWEVRKHPKVQGKAYDFYYVYELTPNEILKTVEDYQGRVQEMVNEVKGRARMVKNFLAVLSLLEENQE